MFPIRRDGKTPLLPWKAQSACTQTQVRKWARQYPQCNWGLDCEKSGLVVLDVDNKNGAKGTGTLFELEHEYGLLPATLSVITPNAGKHFYFKGTTRSRVNFRPGLDTRSSGGYVVLFGSTRPTGEYVLAEDIPTAAAPDWLLSLVGTKAPRSPDAQAWATEPDKPEYIDWAIEWLQGAAPESIAGEGGDDTLVKGIYFTLRDNGISESKAVELVTEHYNEHKCFPPWTDTELALKARNAYKYASLPAATQTLEVRTEAAASAFNDKPLPGIHAASVADIVPHSLPVRRWIVQHRLLRGYATGLIAPGGVGKSTYTFLDALAVATGRDLTGDRVIESGPVVLYNAEDPLPELQMRFAAVAQYYGVPLDRLRNVYLVSGRDHKIRVASYNAQSHTYVPNVPDIGAIKQLIRDTGAILFVGDPFIRLHDVPENDNVAIDKVAEIFTDIADKMQIGVHLVHHTRKLGAAGGEGDSETSRGASSFVSALRIAHTLSVMSPKDAQLHGLSAEERRWYIRLDDAKLNLAPPSDKVRWYKRVSVVLPNGESIGTLELMANMKVIKKATGALADLQAIVALCRPGERVLLSDVVIGMAENDTRTALAITAALRRRFVNSRALQVGNMEVMLEKLGGLVYVTVTALDLTTAIEREMLG